MFNNAMLLPSVWCDEYIWSFQTGVNEYFYGDTIALNCFPVWRFKRRDRDTVFKCSVSLWASLSEGLLVLGLRMDAIEGPLDAVPLEKLMASPKGVGAVLRCGRGTASGGFGRGGYVFISSPFGCGKTI